MLLRVGTINVPGDEYLSTSKIAVEYGFRTIFFVSFAKRGIFFEFGSKMLEIDRYVAYQEKSVRGKGRFSTDA